MLKRIKIGLSTSEYIPILCFGKQFARDSVFDTSNAPRGALNNKGTG